MLDIAHLLIYILIYGIVLGLFTSWLSKTKGYSESAWFFLGLFFNIIALLTIMGAPKKNTVKISGISENDSDNEGAGKRSVEKNNEIENSSEEIKCEHIGESGKFCTKCGARLTPSSVRF